MLGCPLSKTLDRDGGGSIGEEELGKVMKTFGWDPKEEELKVCGRKAILRLFV